MPATLNSNNGRFHEPLRHALGGALVAILALVCGLGSVEAVPKQDDSLEAQVKAVVLTKVLLFVDLGQRSEQDEELTIVILGDTDLEPHLERAFEGFGARYGKLRIEKAESLDRVGRADVLFVPAGADVDLCAVVKLARESGALTVTDDPSAPRSGIMIGLVRDRKRVAIRVNNEEAQAAGVRISAKLLQLATVVETSGGCE